MSDSTDAAMAELGAGFAELAAVVRDDPEHAPERIVELCTRLVPGCEHATIMVQKGESFATLAASDDVAATIDAMERELGDGPCVDAITDEACQVDNDLAVNPTWPTLAARVLAETPVRSAMAYRLIDSDRKRGALNLFADQPGRFDDAARNQAAVLAAFASVALAAADDRQRATNLEVALESNREIGKAIGLLMATHGLDDAGAFAVLRQTSQNMNRKLRDIAAELVNKSGPGPAETPAAAAER